MINNKKVVMIIGMILAIFMVLTLLPLDAFASRSMYGSTPKTTQSSTQRSMQSSSSKTTGEFTDINGHWAAKIIKQWQYYNIISGVGNNKFNPNGKMARRDFAVVLDKLFKYKEIAINSFSDLEQNQYYTEPILRLSAAGVMPSDTKYARPSINITREEATVMLCKALKIEPSNDNVDFKDASKISASAYKYIAAMQKFKYIKGSNGQFLPKGLLTRAEAITIISNVITAFYNKSGDYTNSYNGNGFVVTNNINISDSTIKGNIYIAPGTGSGKITLDNSEITGSIVAISKSCKVTLSSSCDVNELAIRADKIQVTGGDRINNLIIGPESKTSIVTGIPKHMTIYPGGKVTIDKTVFENDRSYNLTYSRDSMGGEVSNENGSVTGGPEIDLKKALIDMNNEVVLTGIGVGSSGDSIISETGIIYSKSEQSPTIGSCDSRQKFTGSTADYKLYSMRACYQDKDTVWSYRAYAINGTGKVGYSPIIKVRSYSFDTTGNIIDTKNNYDKSGKLMSIDKYFQVCIYGTNVPEISSVTALNGVVVYNNDNNWEATKAKLSSSNEVNGYKRYYYTAVISFGKDKNDNVSVDNYYGYRITFGSDKGTKEVFPSYIIGVSSGEEVKSVVTGNASFNDTSTMVVSGNDFTEGTSAVLENGILIYEVAANNYSYPSISEANGWKRFRNYTGYGVLQHNYSVTAYLGTTTNKAYYYVSYVKTASKETYGAIKRINGAEIPVYNGIKSVTFSADKTVATIALNIASTSSIDLTKAGGIKYIMNTTDDKAVGKYVDKSLSEAGASFSNNVLTIVVNGLEANKSYTIALNVTNATGASAPITFNISTIG